MVVVFYYRVLARRWNRWPHGTLIPSFMSGGCDGNRRHEQAASVDRERPGRRHRGATPEWRQDRPYRTADDRQGLRQGVLRSVELRRIPRHGDQSAAAALGPAS